MFDPGVIVATPGVVEAAEQIDGVGLIEVLIVCVLRRVFGDWGEVPSEDKAASDRALVTGDRLLSAYTLVGGTKVWVISEADRSRTTVLLPEEY